MKRAMECVDSEGRVTGWIVHCPACGQGHHFDSGNHPNARAGAKWSFNGDLECPTFSPSMLVVYQPGYAPPALWKTINRIGTLWQRPVGETPNCGLEVPAELVGFCEITIPAIAAALGVDPTWEAIDARVKAWLIRKFPGFTCHSFVRDGWIEYCGDCTHELRGQRVVLPDIEAHT